MVPEPGPERGLGEGYKYVGLGCTFAGGIVMFMAGGWMVDRWLQLTPVCTLIGAVVGAVLSFLHVYWRLQADSRDAAARRRGRS